ncbi:MAG TPA: TetR/AcrR family transcriptional regulator [Acidobacteriota bacterium]|nr:TetR/AcrR family transcriptional regulator [Acidobacteriota bacterium]
MNNAKPPLPLDPDTGPSLSTRERIIIAARAEFARHGPAGARVERIARNAGVNKAMIYYHFNSKDQLYQAVFEHHFEIISQRLKSRLAEPETVEDTLRAATDFWAETFSEMHEFRSLVLRELARPSEEVIGRIAQLMSASGLPQAIQQTFAEETAAGRFRRADPRQALTSFLTMNLGYYFLAPIIDRVLQIDDHEQFVGERKEAVVDLFLNGMRARQP